MSYIRCLISTLFILARSDWVVWDCDPNFLNGNFKEPIYSLYIILIVTISNVCYIGWPAWEPLLQSPGWIQMSFQDRFLKHFSFWNCSQVNATRPPNRSVNIGSGNGLVPLAPSHYLSQCWQIYDAICHHLDTSLTWIGADWQCCCWFSGRNMWTILTPNTICPRLKELWLDCLTLIEQQFQRVSIRIVVCINSTTNLKTCGLFY